MHLVLTESSNQVPEFQFELQLNLVVVLVIFSLHGLNSVCFCVSGFITIGLLF